MLDTVKPLLVVLVLALIVFKIAKPFCLQMMEPEVFARRRNVWLLLTCAAFLAPNFWLFTAVAMPIIFWATARDPHPVALYALLLLVVPPVRLAIPMPVINNLFELSYFRILSLALLLPAAIRIVRSGQANPPGLFKVDLLLIAFGLLQLVLYMPYESITNTLRRSVLFMLDTYLLYFVMSRGATSKLALRDAMMCFCLACLILVPITVFESVKHWLLFTGIKYQWGVPEMYAYLTRGDSLRAQGSAGHSLQMGYMFAIAFGLWLYVGSLFSKRILWAGAVTFWFGLFAAYSRAPWMVAVAAGVLYMIVSPAGRKNVVKVAFLIAIFAVPLSLTPQGARMIDTLPFIGTAEQFNVEYRQQLATLSWKVIKMNPFFGNPFSADYMEEMRQGQGIIDIVNAYAYYSLYYGMVGCTLIVSCLLFPMLRSATSAYAARHEDLDRTNLGVALAACMAGTLLMMATAGLGNAMEQTAWILAGLCSGFMAAFGVQQQVENGSGSSSATLSSRHGRALYRS